MPEIGKHESLEILRELTDRLTKRDAEMLKKTHQLAVLVEIQKLLLQNNDDKLLEKIIHMLGGIINGSRVYLFKNKVNENNLLTMSLFYENHASDVLPYSSLKDDALYKNLPVFSLYMQSRQLFHFRVSDIPMPERQFFENYGIKAILRIPLYSKNDFWGFIGFDNCKQSVLWEEEDIILLSNVAVSLELYIKNKQTEEDLKYSSLLLSKIWDNSSDIILLLNDNNKILQVNHAFTSTGVLDKNQIVEHNLNDLYDKVEDNIVTFKTGKKAFIETTTALSIGDKKFVLVILKNITEE